MLKRVQGWLAGKKTVLVAGLTFLAAAYGVSSGRLSAGQATMLFSIAGTAVGLGDKIERHHREAVAAIESVAAVTSDMALGLKSRIPGDAVEAVKDCVELERVMDEKVVS